MVSGLVQMIILKKPVSKKQDDGNVRQFYSSRSFFAKSTSSSMSLNFYRSIRTIMYIAALLLIGVTPLMVASRL